MGIFVSKKEKSHFDVEPETIRLEIRNKNLREVKKVPDLTELKFLSLPYNDIVILPKNMGTAFPMLQTLRAIGNLMSDLPESFANLQNLTILDLAKNEFNTVPLIVCDLVSLQELSMHFNKIKQVCILLMRILNRC